MQKRRLFYGCIALLVIVIGIVSWISYHKIQDDKYKGMSIIPEKHKDIPLYKGLKPTQNDYIIKGNKWREIYSFYLDKLPSLGWKVEYQGSALDNNTKNDDWGGFLSRWTKEGFDGVLWISSSYNKSDKVTEVIFDKTPIYNSTSWIKEVPKKICIYQNANDNKCTKIYDKNKIKKIVDFINTAFDWNKQVSPRKEISVMSVGNIDIKVLYEKDKEVYLMSNKGIKIMKPDPEFFKLTNLKQ
jgi:hypothetical protein